MSRPRRAIRRSRTRRRSRTASGCRTTPSDRWCACRSPRDRSDDDVVPVECVADIVECASLQHEVVQHRLGRGDERQAVGTWVAAHEHDVIVAWFPVVAHPKAEQLRVELDRLGQVWGAEHDVPYPLRAGLEAADAGGRHEQLVVEDRAVKELERESAGVGSRWISPRTRWSEHSSADATFVVRPAAASLWAADASAAASGSSQPTNASRSAR